MPDAWGYTRDGIMRKAEHEHPGCTAVDVHPVLTGLWCDVTMKTPTGELVERRLYF